MTITKKHLKELADICYMAEHPQAHDVPSRPQIAREIKNFAKRHAPNFSESHWDDYMHKQKKADIEEQKHNPLHWLDNNQGNQK